MSVSRFINRLLLQRALDGRTIAERRVMDSTLTSLDTALEKAPKPIVIVYTDDSEFAPEGKELWGGQDKTTIVLVIAVAGAITIDGETQFSFPVTDHTTEMGLDFLERQIQTVLMDPDNEWAELWRNIVVKVTKWKSIRGSSTKEGVRFAARQISIEVETIHDPVPGAPLQGTWADLVARIEADPDPDFAGLAAPLREILAGPHLASWKYDQATLGASRKDLQGIGLAPLIFHPDGNQEAAIFTRITALPAGVSIEEGEEEPHHD